MADKCVVRNLKYRRDGLSIRQRHNERENASYENDSVIKERAAFNVHFKQPDNTYESMFDKMLTDGTISMKWLGKDPYIVDEFVFDVNTDYFDRHGGYEYAKSFFEEAYRCAVEEIGGEQYVLSAVMHADERNINLTEKLGREIFHFHLHVVYVPVVKKECFFSKDNKNPELAGKYKETITQVSHSKKWPKLKQVDENGEVKRNAKGNAIMVNSYSLLQDHFFEHMRDAGFLGFERGERGSTAEHLTVLEFKTKKETERAAAMTAVVEEKQETAAALDAVIEDKQQTAADLDDLTGKKKKRLEKMDEQITVKTKMAATIADIDNIGKPTLLGSVTATVDEMKKLKTLAKKGVNADEKVADMKRRLNTVENELGKATAELAEEKKNRPSISDHTRWFSKFLSAMKRAPKRLLTVMEDIMRQPPEQPEPERTMPERKRKAHER